MKIALGTVQFGVDYGIANNNGQVSKSSAKAILNYASLQGSDTLDTAVAYGESEQCLGEIGVDTWSVVSKLPQFPENCIHVQAWVEEQVRASIFRLKVNKLAGFLLHFPSQLLGIFGEELWHSLQYLKQENLVDKIGYSIYDPAELDALWAFSPDMVQAPYSIFDQRLNTSGWLQKMVNADVEVHVRSVFLQGLLLMPANNRPEKFSKWSSLWDKWDCWLSDNDLTAMEACISFAMNDERISRVVVGVESVEQLKEIFASTGVALPQRPFVFEIDDALITPSCWSSL